MYTSVHREVLCDKGIISEKRNYYEYKELLLCTRNYCAYKNYIYIQGIILRERDYLYVKELL